FSYSHKDEALRDQLATHLKLLERQGIISSWHDRKIVPGSEWAGDIHHYLEQDDIILLLVSADFLASDYCWDIEIQKALERHEAGTTTVIPVILRPVDWSSAPFARLQALPKNAQPVVTWAPPDLAFMDIAKGIRLRAEELVATRQAQAAQAQKQAALEKYRQKLKTYLAAGALSFIAKENLNDLAQTLGLSQADTAPIDAEETALRDAYRANLERYGETFRTALEYEYPLSDATKADLKDRQIVLTLTDQDVQRIEQNLLAEWQVQQQQKQRQQEQEAAAQRQREQAEAQPIEYERQQQEAQNQQDVELPEQDQPLQQDADNQNNFQEKYPSSTVDGETAATSDKSSENVEPKPLIDKMTMWEIPLNRRSTLWWLTGGIGGLLLWGANSTGGVREEVSTPPRSDSPPVPGGTGGDSSNLGKSDPSSNVRETALKLQSFSFPVVSLNAQGKEINRVQKQNHYFVEELGQGLRLAMVAVPGGSFKMGSPEGEGASNEKPQHSVTVKPFCMGKFAVTQAQWEVVAAMPKVTQELNPDPSRFNGANRPVEQVSWDDAMEFCQRLSRHTNRQYRLPSEAEWEYACRAGTTTPFHFGSKISRDFINCKSNLGMAVSIFAPHIGIPLSIFTGKTTEVSIFTGKTTEVGGYKVANDFGLYDMHGNVWEWCQDVWHENYDGAPADGSAWMEGDDQTRRVLRGGSWGDNPEDCRSAIREGLAPDYTLYVVGFRVVCGGA
ncbi:MAG: SUMF1/EgtB/PvdO family nonheme iron enzyme, partial [Cyanobacteria bacterium J06638_6]